MKELLYKLLPIVEDRATSSCHCKWHGHREKDGHFAYCLKGQAIKTLPLLLEKIKNYE